jgi:8-oxo-dGTP diphosphatase
MEYFSVINDADIFENPTPEPKEYVPRPTVKGIVLDSEGGICIYTIHGRSLFPGGGIEDGETPERAFIRECKEEIGCDVEIISFLGNAVQYRAKVAKKYEFYFFVAKVVEEKGKPTTTQADEADMQIEWLPKDRIKDILESQIEGLPKDAYMPHFNCRTSRDMFLKFLEEENGDK